MAEQSTKHPHPTFDEKDETVRQLQMMEAKKHTKFNTFEQAKLDAIARMMQYDQPKIQGINHEKARDVLQSSIKMDRKPEYDENDDIKKIQESHYKKHKKINTFEQAKLDAMARLAASDQKYAVKAKKAQKNAILSDDRDNDNDNKNVDEIRKQIKEEYQDKMNEMQQNYKDIFKITVKKEEKTKKLLEDTKAELITVQQALKELEQSKMELILSTSREIDALRDALKRTNSS